MVGTLLLVILAGLGCQPKSDSAASVTLLNVSYDPTREFYEEFNQSFAEYWKAQSGQTVRIEQSHGGSGKQARAVIDGLEADVVTLALPHDLDSIAARGGLLPVDWRERFPNSAAPYTSTIVFVVRKGNPKGIQDWDDLVADNVQVVLPNPKTSGGARLIYLAAWGYELHRQLPEWKGIDDPALRPKADEAAAAFVAKLLRNVPVLDSGARGSTNTFVQREIGDVLLTWENEAFLAQREMGADAVEIVVPTLSILAEPPVAVVEGVAKRRGTSEVARAYLDHLYSPQGQQLAAKHFFRPSVPETLSPEERAKFADLELFRVDDVFGGWAKAQAEHFDDGGTFDRIYQPAASTR